jgi:hypothetical protein
MYAHAFNAATFLQVSPIKTQYTFLFSPMRATQGNQKYISKLHKKKLFMSLYVRTDLNFRY